MIFVSQLGLLFLIIASTLLIASFQKNTKSFLSMTRAACFAIIAAYFCLCICFLSDSFEVAYVLAHSSTLLPWFYKFCAVWGGHEGSMLLWVTILAFWTLVLSFQLQDVDEAFSRQVLQVLHVILLGLVFFLIFTSNPFSLQFQEELTSGRDLNPLLQDPGFLLHPPMLYLGYVGYAVPFAFAMAILMRAQANQLYLTYLKPWAMLSWCCLTLGITLGSWWAYRELGWGGFWFWDPVENASLMPWLAGTALLHALIMSEKQQTFLAWTLFMAITAFALSLIGTFLVRSGVITSVHAFAVDPKRGLYILVFLGAMLFWALGLYMTRAHRFLTPQPFYWCSRESGILLNNILLMVMLLVVLLGTLYPMILDGLGLGKISVGAPYFNQALIPFLLLFLVFMALGIQVKWGKDHYKSLYHFFQVGLAFALAFATCFVGYGQISIKTTLAIGLAYWVIISVLWSLWQRIQTAGRFPKKLSYWAMFFAHIGFSLSVIGVAISSEYGIESDVVMSPKETVYLNNYAVKFIKEQDLKGPNYTGTEVVFRVQTPSVQAYIYPQKRIYQIGKMVMTDADIDYNLWRDIYVSLGTPSGERAWSLRLYYKPMIRWIWLGGLLASLGGGLAFIYYFQSVMRIKK